MTDSQLDTLDTPPPDSSSSRSRSLSEHGAVAVCLAMIASVTAGWLLKLYPPETPWWGPPGAVLIAGMAASERARLVTAVLRARFRSRKE